MKLLQKAATVSLALGLCFAINLILTNDSFAQDKKETEKVDIKKVFAEIAGDWEFEMEGMIVSVTFYVEDDVFYALNDQDNMPGEMEPTEDNPMEWTIIGGDGSEITLTFSRDEEEKLTKCLAVSEAMGFELEGVKVDG